MRHIGSWLAISAAALAGSAAAQLLPPVGDVARQAGGIGRGLGGVGGAIGDSVSQSVRDGGSAVAGLAQGRLARLSDLVRQHPADLDRDSHGDVAVRGELIALDPDAATLNAATAAGFSIIDDIRVEGLDLRTVRLRTPAGISLRDAQKRLSAIVRSGTIQSNPIYERSGNVGAEAPPMAATGNGRGIGLVDGGVAPHPALPSTIVQKGFATGAPFGDAHATAIASIMVGRGAVHGVAPAARLYVADIYGRDPRGGSALAIAQAIGWLVQSGVSVINLSLVGPDSPLLARAVAAADARGVVMVAAVGNDGAAAPFSYPASYAHVIAITGVDGKGRALIEAGRATHLDFAAPGAGVMAAAMHGGRVAVRGTSFAAPFVAARLAMTMPDGRISYARAVDLLIPQAHASLYGSSVSRYGRGIICGDCAALK